MGASGWSYSVPYQQDVAGALEQLRADVYASGEYYEQPADPSLLMTEDEFRATLDLENDRDGIQQFILEEWLKARVRPAAVDPDTLLASQPDSGTHSIIDICDGIAEQPCLFTAAPLTAEQEVEFFGTNRPSTTQVRAWLAGFDIARIRARWEAAYLISYTSQGLPEEIHFAGYSGD